MVTRNGAVAVLVLALAVSASACAEPTGSDALSLAQTKSPVQLLRNEVALRVPAEAIGGVENSDRSEACGDDESMRSWHSSVLLGLKDGSEMEVDDVIDTLSASFEEDGWIATPGNERSDRKQAVFSSGPARAEIRISAAPGSMDTRGVLVSVVGPCVQTAGPDSDEVTSLEGKD